MKQSKIHIRTLKESPFEGKMESQHLMFRSGMMKKNGAGDYTLMPYGEGLYQVIKTKVDQMFEHLSYQKLHTLSYDEKEVLMQIRSDIVSYKDLPVRFQTDTTLRREKHSVKHGLLKSRVTPIKGMQVLSEDEQVLSEALKSFWNQLVSLHDALGVPYKMTRLFDPMGPQVALGTWLPTTYGDMMFYNCKSCSYCSDEKGAEWRIAETSIEDVPAYEEILTPAVKTIADLEVFLSIRVSDLMKTLLLECQMKSKMLTIAVVLRGDRELNLSKVARYLDVDESALQMVSDEAVVEAAGTVVGFAGPIGLTDVMLLVDEEVAQGRAMVTGANKRDYHLKNVVYGRDFQTKHLDDFSTVLEGDLCPVCGEPLVAEMGYTVTRVRNYKNALSEQMDIKFVNDQMKEERPFVALGEIDLYRLLIAYLDHHYDEGGFVFKQGLSPYDVHIVVPNAKKEEQCILADQLAFELEGKGKRVLVDDRKNSAGAKFKDSDLLGIPIRITAGKRVEEGIVELKYRNSEDRFEMTIKEVLEKF
ncbi:MAG: hypothetical protein JXO44_12190 [Clostridia bacterium]|nr:hypothetical protein [Clostridia bacterium]